MMKKAHSGATISREARRAPRAARIEQPIDEQRAADHVEREHHLRGRRICDVAS